MSVNQKNHITSIYRKLGLIKHTRARACLIKKRCTAVIGCFLVSECGGLSASKHAWLPYLTHWQGSSKDLCRCACLFFCLAHQATRPRYGRFRLTITVKSPPRRHGDKKMVSAIIKRILLSKKRTYQALASLPDLLEGIYEKQEIK